MYRVMQGQDVFLYKMCVMKYKMHCNLLNDTGETLGFFWQILNYLSSSAVFKRQYQIMPFGFARQYRLPSS